MRRAHFTDIVCKELPNSKHAASEVGPALCFRGGAEPIEAARCPQQSPASSCSPRQPPRDKRGPSPTACAGPASPGHSISSCTAVPAHGEAGVPTLQKAPCLKTSPAPCPRSYDRTVVQTCICRILEGEPVLAPSISR